MIFESHAHYDDEAFDEDREKLFAAFQENQIGYILNIGASLSTTQTTIALAEKYPFVYAAAGVHPSETAQLNEENFAWLKEQCLHEKVVAVGETGLDYYWKEPEKEVQKKWFRRQLMLANEAGLPVVIHSRDAARDTLEIMKDTQEIEKKGVIHCYSYTKETAREFLEMGYCFGIGGVITFKNAKKLREAVEYLPMEAILLETDSPYLAPEPYRGKRNCSLYLPFVVSEIAKIKNITEERVMELTEENAKRLFFGE